MVDIRDIKIMEILQKNGRSTASDIAKEVDLSIPAVGERIKKLIEKPYEPLTKVHKHAKIPYRVEGTDEDA